MDHVISLKHGGQTSPDNLALACFFCNRHKGTDVGSVLPDSGVFVRLYNPRTDLWAEHFSLSKDDFVIAPRTDIAAATARLLGLNTLERRLEREVLHEIGRYPLPPPSSAFSAPPDARNRVNDRRGALPGRRAVFRPSSNRTPPPIRPATANPAQDEDVEPVG